jgi:hypothetical protein
MTKQHAVTVVFYISTDNEQQAEHVVNSHLINEHYLTPLESYQIVDVSEVTVNG